MWCDLGWAFVLSPLATKQDMKINEKHIILLYFKSHLLEPNEETWLFLKPHKLNFFFHSKILISHSCKTLLVKRK